MVAESWALLAVQVAARHAAAWCSGDNGRMRARYLAIGAAVWAAGYAAIYVAIVRGQGNSPAWWYVALLGAGVALLVLSSAGRWPRPTLISGTVLLALAVLAGLLSIGILLLPGVVAAVAAASSARPSRTTLIR